MQATYTIYLFISLIVGYSTYFNIFASIYCIYAIHNYYLGRDTLFNNIGMEVKFIGQGLSRQSDRPASEVINEVLENFGYKEFAAFVAFASEGGIKLILSNLKKFIRKGGKVRLYIGVDLHATSKEALELLLKENIPSYIVYSPNDITYHPKVYTFEGESSYYIIVGSSNLTTKGLYQNVEASLCVSNKYQADEGRELLSDIYDYYNDFLNGQSTTCKTLTQEILDILINSKVVLSEKTVRDFNKKYIGEVTTAQLSDIEKLNGTFAKLKRNTLSGQRKQRVRTEVLEAGEKDILVHTTSTDISANSIWIETREMTGGSRNILDLSAKGKQDKVIKPGSVEFFGIDKSDHTQRLDISLVYNNKIYPNNTILWGSGNNNWRIQLKGEAADKSKLTDISNPKLGKYGGFQHKILVFEKTEIENQYNLHIIDESEMESMIAQSYDWARSGNGNGRAYGYINPQSE